jgi:hypothetical protein
MDNVYWGKLGLAVFVYGCIGNNRIRLTITRTLYYMTKAHIADFTPDSQK